MAYKFKLKEAPAPNLAKQGGYKVGDVTYSNDGDTRFTVDAVNPESGKVSWKITNLPNFDKLFDELRDATETAKGVYTKVKDDEKFREIYEDIRLIRNKVRTHLRKEYPEDYKRMTINEDDMDEASMSGAAGAYNTPYAFVRKPLKPKSSKKKKKSKYKMSKPSGLVNYLDYAVKEGVGATLGPGPKAGEDGVNDNAYVKQFKYKLVKKNKDGTYVQPPSTLPVRKLWGE